MPSPSRVRHLLRLLCPLLLGVGCLPPMAAAPATFESLDRMRREEFAYVRGCSGLTPAVEYDALHFVEVPTRWVEIPSGNGEPTRALAFFDPRDSTIWLASGRAQSRLLTRHELLHAYGVRGHGQRVWQDCHAVTDRLL